MPTLQATSDRLIIYSHRRDDIFSTRGSANGGLRQCTTPKLSAIAVRVSLK
ncbi:hypothetical protein JYQ62_21655 [Nostoc sp. UHCC 0702]|nr:hypothetical protein JYQ62_21655 [Nostoc sp. UHCC 0702]